MVGVSVRIEPVHRIASQDLTAWMIVGEIE
jgi:hypothetical protein